VNAWKGLAMTAKEKLHRVIEELPEVQAQDLLIQLEARTKIRNGNEAFKASPNVESNESEAAPDSESTSFWDELDEEIHKIPEAEWEKLPSDLSANLDHYIYGTPK
jgi:hypothetical protein